MRVYPRFHSLHPPSTEVTTLGDCRECYRAAQREWRKRNKNRVKVVAKCYRDRKTEAERGTTDKFLSMKCNQPGCGKTFTNLRDLAGHKRGHSGLPPTEDVSLLPSSMGGGWNP